MRILVLGGTRFIGPYVVRRLVEMGHPVAVFHRGQTESTRLPPVRHLYGDHARLTDYVPDFRALAPDVVLDMIASTGEAGQLRIDTFKGLARRLVAISSADVYRAYDRFRGVDPGPPDPAPLTEDSPLRDRLFPYRDQARGPEDPFFSYEKILMERAVMSTPELPGTIVRLPMVYGPGDPQHRLFPYLKRMDDRRPVILLAQDLAGWRGVRGYVEDIAHAIALCVADERAVGRIYHVADRQGLTEAGWVRRLARIAGWDGEIIALPPDRLPAHLQHPYDASQDWALDSSRIRQELEYREQTPSDEAMRRSIGWERANSPAEVDPTEFDYAAEDAALAAYESIRLPEGDKP